jgi:hypothetical protein
MGSAARQALEWLSHWHQLLVGRHQCHAAAPDRSYLAGVGDVRQGVSGVGF